MDKKVVILILVLTFPLLLGFWVGYNVGHGNDSSNGQARQDSKSGALFEQASYSRPGERDSLADQSSKERRNAITRAVAMASPAVVGINVVEDREYRVRDPWAFFFGGGDQVYRQEVKGLGSGVIISPEGYLITNHHVAGGSWKRITVTTTDGHKYTDVELIGTDLASDIALLRIKGSNFPYVRLGNSDEVIIGEWVIALGNPFGLFDINDKPTVTVGVVSSTGMNLRGEEGAYYRNMIQTDAAINEGNSGGALVNSLGELIGINTLIYTPNRGNIGLGFAIPINRVKNIVTELKNHGTIARKVWVGWDLNTVDDRIARTLGMDRTEGVIVSNLTRNSPATRGGLEIGDVILEINGKKISSEDNVWAILNDAKAGDVLHLKVLRENKTISLDIRLEGKRT